MIFVRHAPAVVDENVPTKDWPLVPGAETLVAPIAARLPPVARVVASDTRRARDTAALLGLPVSVDDRLTEIARSWSEDLAYDCARYFNGETLTGWEPQHVALARVRAAVEEHGDAIYVSHGTVLSLYLASVVPGLDPLGFWSALAHPDAWIVRGHEISRIPEDR